MQEDNTLNDDVDALKARIKELEEAQQKPEPQKSDDRVAEITNPTVKENISKAYEERDQYAKRVQELEREKREAELKALEEAGKQQEADKIRMDELKRQLQERDDKITSLTRDNTVRSVLNGLDFINDRAAEIAYKDIVANLVQNADGAWVSRTGLPIQDYVNSYERDEGNKFLFKVKQSSGSQSMTSHTTSAPVDTNKSIKDMTTEELLQAAAEGKLDGGKQWY